MNLSIITNNTKYNIKTLTWHIHSSSNGNSSTQNTNSNIKNQNLPPVSLIVVNYNGKSKLGSLFDKFLSSLLTTDYPNFDVLFIDNASTDNSIDHVIKNFPNTRLKIIKLKQNIGYSGAINLALNLTQSEIIGIMNNDLIFTNPAWLKSLIQFMLTHPDVKIVQPLLTYDNEFIDSAGGELNLLMVAWDRYSRKRITEIDHKKPIFTLSPSGALFLIKKDLIKQFKNKIFDEEYFAYYEDVELGLRTNLMGYKIATIPWITVIHKRSSSWGWASPNKFYYMRRNALLMSIKFLNLRAILTLFPIQLLSTFYAAYIYYNYTKDPKHFLIATKIIIEILTSFKKYWNKRDKITTQKHLNKLPLSTTLILNDNKLTLTRKILLEFVNLAITLSGMKNLKITHIEKYKLFEDIKTINKQPHAHN